MADEPVVRVMARYERWLSEQRLSAATRRSYRRWVAELLEAMLATAKKPCTAQQLARGLGWTLTRTLDALDQLEASLANTGQILTRLGHHSYMLGPRPGLLHRREIARCPRYTREPLDLAAAAVLHRALTCPWEGRARDVLWTNVRVADP